MNIWERAKLNRKMYRLKKKVCRVLRPADALETLNFVEFSYRNLPDCKKEGLLDECLKVINHAEKIRKRIDAA